MSDLLEWEQRQDGALCAFVPSIGGTIVVRQGAGGTWIVGVWTFIGGGAATAESCQEMAQAWIDRHGATLQAYPFLTELKSK